MEINHANWSKLRKISFILDNKFRKRILELLIEHGMMTVTDLIIKMRMEQASVSTHLGRLRELKIVNYQKDGKYVYYSVNEQKLKQYCLYIDKIAKL